MLSDCLKAYSTSFISKYMIKLEGQNTYVQCKWHSDGRGCELLL